jgi:DNA polymerase-3 subunit delta
VSAAPLVYVYGDEPLLMDRACAKVEAAALAGGDPSLNRQVFEAPGAKAGEVLAAARTLPFLGERRLVVVRDAHRWSADEWRPLLPYLEQPNPSTCLLFVAEQLDRRNKAGKLLSKVARLVACRSPREGELPGWIQRLAREAGLHLQPRVVQSLALRVGPDLQVLHQEIAKLRLVAAADGSVSDEDLEALVGESRGTTVFAFCDALGARDLAGALKGLRRLLQMGEAPVKLLFMVVRHLRHLWLGWELRQGGRVDRKQAAQAMGVPPFAVEGILKQAGNWGATDLEGAFAAALRADLALKSGGGVEVLQELVLNLCGPNENARSGSSRGARESARGRG